MIIRPGTPQEAATLDCVEARRLLVKFNPHCEYLIAECAGVVIGCAGWRHGRHAVILGPSFVRTEYRRLGVFSALHDERVRRLSGVAVASCTRYSLPLHLKHGARIVREYKSPLYRIRYDSIAP